MFDDYKYLIIYCGVTKGEMRQLLSLYTMVVGLTASPFLSHNRVRVNLFLRHHCKLSDRQDNDCCSTPYFFLGNLELKTVYSKDLHHYAFGEGEEVIYFFKYTF